MSLKLSSGRPVGPGDLRHYVALEKPNEFSERDSVGEQLTQYLPVMYVWAGIWPLSGREQLIAAQQQASTTHLVAIWWTPASAKVDAAWRVKFGDRNLIIDGPPKNIDEANVLLELSCVEGKRPE